MLLINVINFSINGEKFEILFLVSSVNLMFSVGRYNNDKMMDSNKEILQSQSVFGVSIYM